MAKIKYTNGVTPIGESLFSHVKETEVILGKDTNKHTIMVKFAPAEAEALKAKIDAEWNKFVEAELKDKKVGNDPSFGIKDYKGEEYFKFSSTAHVHTRDGRDFDIHVPIFDSSNTNVADRIKEIGSGSQVRIAYELVPFYMNTKIYGVSLRLKAIQIHKLNEIGNQDASSFGFEADSTGYVAKTNDDTDDDDEAPFYDSTVTNDGDF